jgi:hypothetical protein
MILLADPILAQQMLSYRGNVFSHVPKLAQSPPEYPLLLPYFGQEMKTNPREITAPGNNVP